MVFQDLSNNIATAPYKEEGIHGSSIDARMKRPRRSTYDKEKSAVDLTQPKRLKPDANNFDKEQFTSSDSTAVITKNKKSVKKKESYTVHRLMERAVIEDKNKKRADDKNIVLVFWHNYPFTQCTYQSIEDIDGCADELTRLNTKEDGLLAVLQNIANGPDSNKYRERWLGKLFEEGIFKDTARLLKLYKDYDGTPLTTKNMALKKFICSYWKFKVVELQWLKVLDPNADGVNEPLYLECWAKCLRTVNSRIPKFQMLVKNQWTAEALQFIKEHRQFKYGCLPNCECTCQVMCAGKRSHHEAKEGIFVEFQNGLLNIAESLCTKRDGYYFTYGCGGAHELCGTSAEDEGQCSLNENCPSRHLTTIEKDDFKECTSGRSCESDCPSAILRKGRTVPLVVFYEIPMCGWGIRSLTKIYRGTVVSDYIGKVKYSNAQSENETYEFDCTDSAELRISKTTFAIDASTMGNEARFFSHSCNPNLVSIRVYQKELGDHFFKILLVANKDIEAGEQLTFRYNNRPRRNGQKCKCDPDCKFLL